MSEFKLNGRLCSAASFVRQRAVLADIGTDHAYLPLFLLNEGRVERAFATDINEGPLRSAERNIREAGFSDKTTLMLTDGAYALSGLGITDYTVCGMGGELIADIIENAPHLRDKSVRLILQPMTKQAHLRRYLHTHGFVIRAEAYSFDSGKYYVCIMAEYADDDCTGRASDDFSDCEKPDFELAARGARIIGEAEYHGYLKAKLKSLTKAARGKVSGGEDNSSELKSIEAIGKILENH